MKKVSNNYKNLKVKDGITTCQIIDGDEDLIDCTFHGNYSVEIKTKKYNYITFHPCDLYDLLDLIEESCSFNPFLTKKKSIIKTKKLCQD